MDQNVFRLSRRRGEEITKLSVLISERRLAVAVSVRKGRCPEKSGILIWDWRSGRKLLVSDSNPLLRAWGRWTDLFGKKSSGFCLTEAQAIDDYRILGIIKPTEVSNQPLLVLWDTSGSKTRQSVFEMPSNKLGTVYVPERFVGSVSTQRDVGIQRADPNQKIIGVVCQGFRTGCRLDDDYMVVVSTADLRVRASTQSAGELRIRWGEWQSSATIVRVKLSSASAAYISGSRFFALVRGDSDTKDATLRVYDFSPGARGQRHPNRPAVQELVVYAACVVGQHDITSWAFSEDNLLMFLVSTGHQIHGFLM